MDRLSEQIISAALTITREWDPRIKISVNISPSQFADGWLAERIVRILTETSFPAERLVIERALEQHDGNVSRVARLLGLSRASLYRRLEKHGLGTGDESDA